MLMALTLLGSIICIIEGIPLAKKKLWKELTTVVFLVFIAIFLGIIKVLDIPSPIHVLENFIDPFGRKVFRN